MRTYWALGLGLTIMIAGAANAQMPTLTPDQENTLTREIGDRIATQSVDCIRLSPRLQLTVVSDDLLIYRIGGKRYLSRTAGTCHGLARGDKPILSLGKSRICAGDWIAVEDLVSGIRTGGCAIGRFAVYAKPGKDD
ncbi:hypothetical protein [Sphingobium sp. CAP-1]|uniref:hypothetical protein n=1 Tax=Sphingobium sp. CAP-1 TaxID=2676077 RepID=UPI0012BB3F31|nr:hypothetical protein [Sphingobium sp. CAP-1]QGP79437.1 hypothetical protein GL174_10940 [Sphingobium sp. CAP-1]